MYAVSAAFLEQLRGPHQVTTKVEYTKVGVDGPWIELPQGVVSGQVTYDRSGDNRRGLTLEVADWTNPFHPDAFEAQTLLSPYDTLVKVYRGIVHPGGESEFVPLGVYRVYDSTQNANSLSLTGYSQEVDIRDRRFYFPWIRFGAFFIHNEIELLITTAISDANIVWYPGLSNHQIRNYFYEEDRLGALNDLVASVGGDWWCAPTGEFVIGRPHPGTGPTDWSINSGATGVLIEYSKKRSREGVYNGVVVKGENLTGNSGPLEGIRSLQVDNDPTSPTYWGPGGPIGGTAGPFGRVPRFYSSQYITTQAQADAAALGFLAREKGLTTSMDFGSVPNPALDVNDFIEVVYPDGKIENHVIDKLTIGLGADEAMTGTSRVMQVI